MLKKGIIKKPSTILRIVCLMIIVLLSTGNLFSQTYFNNVDHPDSLKSWLGMQNIDSSYAHSAKLAAFTDSIHPYGLGTEMFFPEEVKNKNVLLSLSGYILSDTVSPNSLYVITIENRGETAFWKGIYLSKTVSEKEKWFPFSDSILIPATLTKTGKLKIYHWNAGRKNRIYIDDLKISFKPSGNPSFIEDVPNSPANTLVRQGSIIYANNFYQILEQNNNGFAITGQNGISLIDHISYFVNEESKEKNLTTFSGFKYTGKSIKADKTVLTFKTKTGFEKVKLTLICNDLSPEIEIAVTRKYRKTTTVDRAAVVLHYSVPLKEVYRANRKADVNDFQPEYWLDKQGFTCGNSNNSLTIYNTPGVSSIQLNTQTQQAVINLDYQKDHPYFQFPLNADTFDLKVDKSASVFRKRQTASSSFKIYAGKNKASLPRFMKNPKGYLATYIWTEHADWGDIRTHRATYFGSEKITNADSATGGFVKYNIPVTKSVFYDNPDSLRNTPASDSLFTSLESAIVTDTDFRDFLFDIHQKGNEVCLHTPEQYTTTLARLKDALEYMRSHFNSPTWIDHGYNNQPQNNREDFVCSGIDNYAAKLWKKYNIRYFWNPYYEDYQTFSDWGFFGSIEKFYSGWGDFYPKPDYWQHPTLTANFYHWPTYSVLYIERENLWNYFFSKHQLDVFTHSWGVEINHCYPAWILPGKGFWKYAPDGTIVAMDGFNRTLQLMDEYRKKGVLNVTTIEQFMKYRLALEKVSYNLLPDGRIKLTNNGSQIIKNLSMATKAKAVLVNDLKPAQKQVDNDIIFWFNLKAGESVVVRVVE